MKLKNNKPATPADPLGQRLTQLFPYRWKWLSMDIDSSFVNPEWTTNKKYPLRPRVMWKKWQDAAEVIGVRFGSKTRYAMIDLDKGSDYFDQLPTIRGALETVGICRTITIRSSFSGGIHLYIPLPQEFPTFGVACMVRQCLEAQGFTIAPGQLEIFPNTKEYAKSWLGEYTEYQGHRLPLQPGTGSVILTDDLQPIEGGDSLSRFFSLFDNAALFNEKAEIAEAIAQARANRRYRKTSTTARKLDDWKADLQHCIDQGWTGDGQTNSILKDLACYGVVFEGLKGFDLFRWMLDKACNMPGFGQWCDHQDDIDRRCTQWAHSAEKFWWPLGGTPLRERAKIADIAKERATEARTRISRAMRELCGIDQGIPIREIVSRLCEAAQCSASTLYKNKDLWHPDHQAEQPDHNARPVTAHQTGEVTDPAEALRLIREGLGTPDTWAVTGQGGDNEVCNLKSSALKIFTSEGKEGGCGGKEGLSTGPGSTGWLPSLDWVEGAVGDV